MTSDIDVTYGILAALCVFTAIMGKPKGYSMAAIVAASLIAFNSAWYGEPLRWVMALIQDLSTGI